MTVALSGDGGDELLAGYVTHTADALRGFMHRLPSPAIRALSRASSLLPEDRKKVGTSFKIRQFLAGAHLDAIDGHAWWRMLATEERVRDLMTPEAYPTDFNPFAPFRKVYDEAPDLPALDRLLYVDYRTWLQDDILVKVDRASMAHGLEVRSPFLDHRLVELCAALPPRAKLRWMRGKHVLRKIAEPHLPKSIINRKKAGFNSPVAHWISESWRELASDTLLGADSQDTSIIDRAAAGRLLTEHLQEGRDHGHLIFALLMLQLWQREISKRQV